MGCFSLLCLIAVLLLIEYIDMVGRSQARIEVLTIPRPNVYITRINFTCNGSSPDDTRVCAARSMVYTAMKDATCNGSSPGETQVCVVRSMVYTARMHLTGKGSSPDVTRLRLAVVWRGRWCEVPTLSSFADLAYAWWKVTGGD